MCKVKVWGKEVKDCYICNYCSAYEPRCIIGKFDLYDGYELGHRDDIHKDCPFSKPITKEVIEGFGFKLKSNETYVTIYTKVYNTRNEENNFEIHFWKEDGIIQIVNEYLEYEDNYTLFQGIVNNPVELEFILKSIGVIE